MTMGKQSWFKYSLCFVFLICNEKCAHTNSVEITLGIIELCTYIYVYAFTHFLTDLLKLIF